jgi:hypothetical protein
MLVRFELKKRSHCDMKGLGFFDNLKLRSYLSLQTDKTAVQIVSAVNAATRKVRVRSSVNHEIVKELLKHMDFKLKLCLN